MPSNPMLQVRIKNARSSESELRTVKQKINDNLADIVILKRLFAAWKSNFESNGGDNAAAYQEALKTLPTDNPNTPTTNEAVSESEMIKKAEQYFGKTWSSINTDDVDGIQNNLQEIQSKVKEYIGKNFSVDMQLSDIKSEIDDLTALQKSSGIIDGGDST